MTRPQSHDKMPATNLITNTRSSGWSHCSAAACTALALSTAHAAGCGTDAEQPGDTSHAELQALRAPVDLMLVDVFPGVQFSRPIAVVQPPGERNSFYIAEQGGAIYRARANHSRAELVLDLNAASDPFTASAEFSLRRRITATAETATGLLGIAISPRWQYDHDAYIFFTSSSSTAPSGVQSKVAKIHSRDSGAHFEPPNSPIVTLDLPSQQAIGGQALFGPDGLLYVGFGDGSSDGEDGQHRAQDPRTLFGKIVRFQLPELAGSLAPPGRAHPEVYALGFRNPWRFSFDRVTKALWLGDTGGLRYEEVDRVLPGGNYGWDACEGAHRFDPTRPDDPASGLCDQPDTVSPALEYSHAELGGGAAVIGGHVYRGAAIPGLVGSYVFGDFVHGTIWRLVSDGAGRVTKQVILQTSPGVLSSFGEGLDGELYVVQLDGHILKIAPR